MGKSRKVSKVKTPELLPKGQFVLTPERGIAETTFPDMAEMNKELEEFLVPLAKARLEELGKQSASKSVKIHHVDAWDIPAARFIDKRAKAMFKEISGFKNAVVDLSWASVYFNGDYILPHAHSRSQGSVVYMVSLGDDSDDDPMSGKFMISDPRLQLCCQDDGKYMSNNYMPDLKEGSMIVFPASIVHMVTPYMGDRPRITLAWNINEKALPLRKGQEAYGIPPHPGKAGVKRLTA
ncbi:hypothetical protein GUA87_00600 [Sneathiella sp. P13V-1]|uniref:putative 2OG-Fe(II) oxygenase n=1 Tax=Sneathiella sp. P13V-1 TaxID=2697366 RepID=UPI00187B9521|nr:putative 2OG-Fe(II) oxygenase [Sneathiella sp. P13V-1]MBE7635327.1 hypothetical protein [Sneathiella sp. P13V-1]